MFKAIKALLLLAVVINLSACSHFFGGEESDAQQEAKLNKESHAAQQALIKKVEALELSMKSWQEVQPSVDRLVAIESELNVLISQLNTLVMEAEKEQQQVVKNKPKKAITTTPKAIIASSDKHYSLQLASIATPAKVEQSWLDILKGSAGQLGGEQPLVETIQVKNKTYYRIKIGKFSSKQIAKRECEQLKESNIDCIISAYSKQTLGDFLLEKRAL